MSEALDTNGSLASGALARGDPRPASPQRRARYSARRFAFCPLCGEEQIDKLALEVRGPEAALCIGRCVVAWEVLSALRVCESENELIVARRRTEWETRESQAPTLSELLLRRWRAGDWTVAPEDLIDQL